MEDGEKKFWAKVGIDATIFLAAVTGLLYVVGGYYQAGYLQKWGVEADFFASDIYGRLVSGTIVLSGFMISLSVKTISYGIIVLMCTVGAIDISKEESIRNIFNRLRKKFGNKKDAEPENEPPKFLMYFLSITLKSIVTCLLLLAVLYAFYSLIIFSSEQGEKNATKEYEQYSQGTAQSDQKSLFSKLRTYCIDGTQRSALLLATDRSTYALYFPKSKTQEESVEIVAASRITCIKATRNVAP